MRPIFRRKLNIFLLLSISRFCASTRPTSGILLSINWYQSRRSIHPGFDFRQSIANGLTPSPLKSLTYIILSTPPTVFEVLVITVTCRPSPGGHSLPRILSNNIQPNQVTIIISITLNPCRPNALESNSHQRKQLQITGLKSPSIKSDLQRPSPITHNPNPSHHQAPANP